MESRIINKCGFSYLVVIWYEVMNHEEYLEGSGQMMFCSLFCICKKENDREINEWYNEEK